MAEDASKRLQCLVPFCRRTRKGSGEWICAVHWRTVPSHVKTEKFNTFRAYRRRFGRNPFWHYKAGSPDRLACVEADRRCNHAWAMCKRAAVEIAAGL